MALASLALIPILACLLISYRRFGFPPPPSLSNSEISVTRLMANILGTIGKAILGGFAGGIQRRIEGTIAGKQNTATGYAQPIEIENRTQLASQGQQLSMDQFESSQFNAWQRERERMKFQRDLQFQQHMHEMDMLNNRMSMEGDMMGQPPWWATGIGRGFRWVGDQFTEPWYNTGHFLSKYGH